MTVKNYLTGDSPGLKPDWFDEIHYCPQKIKHLYILNFRRFSHIWTTAIWAAVTNVWFTTYLYIRTMLLFICLVRNTLVFKPSLRISAKSLLIQFSDIFSIRALILSWLWVLLGWSRPEVFCNKNFLEISQKLTGKHLCQSLFFNNTSCGCFLNIISCKLS